MCSLRLAAFAASAALLAVPARAQQPKEAAFGFWKGMTLKQARAAAPLMKHPSAAHYYATKQPPNPVFPFVLYGVVIGPKSGVCGVTGMTEHQPDGSKLFEDMAGGVFAMFTKRYGEPSHAGEGEATRTVRWANPQGPNTSIALTVHHADDGSAYVEVAYSFSNLPQCSTEIQQGL